MNNADRRRAALDAGAEIGRQQALQDQQHETVREQAKGRSGVLPLERIVPRDGGTRGQEQAHVASLAENIARIGLLHPIVVDQANRVIAGSHRLAAILLIREQYTDAFALLFPNNLVPVRILPFDSQDQPEQALHAEVSENEHRRDYNRQEIHQLVDRMKAAGYKDSPGRPKAGDRPLAPALMVALGKSRRSVMRLLAEPTPPVIMPSGTITEHPCRRALVVLSRAINRYRTIAATESESVYREVMEALLPAEHLITALIQANKQAPPNSPIQPDESATPNS